MTRRRFGSIILAANEILIRQKSDTEILYSEDQGVIDWVKSNVHRYHAKMQDGILYATQLDDNNSAKYEDGQTASVSDVSIGDTLVYIPKFYATLMLEQGDTSVYRFSREAINSNSFAFGDVFIGAYGGDYTNNTLNSISHPGSTTGTYKTKKQLESMAESKGNGYSLVTLDEHNLVGLLYVAIHHNTDCKGTLGAGSNTYDRPCGTTTPVGMKESEPGDVYTSFLGLENWWGGRYEIVGKIAANIGAINGIYKVTERDDSIREIQSIAPTSQWLYPRKMILGKRFDIVADPICYAGEITSGHGWNSEQYMRSEADRVVIRGGFQADISSGFAFLAARFTNTESGTYNTMTGRLAYKGSYEFIDTDSYREKFDPNFIKQFKGGQITAVYQSNGDSNIIDFSNKISGDFYMYVDGVRYPSNEGFTYSDQQEHTVVLKIKEKQTDMSNMFNSSRWVKSIDLSEFDTSLVTTMKNCFFNCYALEDICLENVDTFNVQDMSSMFSGCNNLKHIDISSFDARNVTTMHSMFRGCSGLEEIDMSRFRTPKLVNLYFTFGECKKLKYVDISNLRSNDLLTMDYAFSGCESLQCADLSSLDLSKIDSFVYVFNGCTSLSKLRMINNIDSFTTFNGFLSNVADDGVFEYDIDGLSNSLMKSIPSSWKKVPVKKIEESCTWICPQYYNKVSIFAVGGGGGGGPVYRSGNNGHGGCGGFTTTVNDLYFNSGDEVLIEIGSGGIGGQNTEVGTSGGDTTVICEARNIDITAKGGSRGDYPWNNNNGQGTPPQQSLGGSGGGIGRVGPTNGGSNGSSVGPSKSYEGHTILMPGQGTTTAAFGEDWGCGPYYGSGGAATGYGHPGSVVVKNGIGGSTLGGTWGIDSGNGMFYGSGGSPADFFREEDGVTSSDTESGKKSGNGHSGVVLIRLDTKPSAVGS